MNTIAALILSIITGIIIELFFQLIKYRDNANTKDPIPYVGPFDSPNTYITVQQYIQGGSRQFYRYFIFRTTPPLITLLLLSSVLTRYSESEQYTLHFLLLAALVSLIPRDIFRFFKTDLLSEKIVHVINSVAVLAIAVLVGLLSSCVDVSTLAPSVDGVVDNLWASLFTALLVVLFIRTSSSSAKRLDREAEDLELTNYVIKSYNEIKERFYHVIKSACDINDTSVSLMYAVLIYENINRPHVMRVAESMIAKLFKLPLSTGIAQVRHETPLSDSDSIRAAARILKNTRSVITIEKTLNQSAISNAIKKYNKSRNYEKSIMEIHKKLAIYAWSDMEREEVND